MIHRLRALVAIAEGPCSVPSSCTGWLTVAYSCSSRGFEEQVEKMRSKREK